ncbi:cell division ATP-binding protein FtsE [Parvicella tangerina]|uniref:Cell division ATP-binding protein FtsE n=1 Tax=Parvicella tangerina TaxID=2829795 RepID=A0A916NCJ0_9FLAO|nr:ATP-binding cassette domain-containing protein [Parvicella tangerina]CAG5085340.1 Cell division ATP-binding protein FtsE [Parvicella tangerina]
MSVVAFHNVTISQGGNEVLRMFDFSVEPGEFVYLIGKTGSGKSSLLKTLYGELKPSGGDANFLEYNLTKLRKRKILQLRRKIGIVFQDFQLLTDRNVYSNLEFVLKATGWKKKSDIKHRINEVLLQVDLPDASNKMPHQLSGGEQQRVAIARALLNDPEVIVADEPTGNLDPQTTDAIMALLFEIGQRGKTVIMATHDYEMIKKFPSRTLKCIGGKLEEVNLTAEDAFS